MIEIGTAPQKPQKMRSSELHGRKQTTPQGNPVHLETTLLNEGPADLLIRQSLWSGAIEPLVCAEIAGPFVSLSPRKLKDLARQKLIRSHPVGRVRKRWRFRLSEVTEDVAALYVKLNQQPL